MMLAYLRPVISRGQMVVILVFFLGGCFLPSKRKPEMPPPLFATPDTLLLNSTVGYTTDLFGRSIAAYTYNGDTVKTGTPLVLHGKVIAADSLPRPRRVPVGKPRQLPLYSNRHRLPSHLRESRLTEDRLQRFIPQDRAATSVIIRSTGDTIQTRVSLPISGRKITTRQPKPVNISKPQRRDDAINDFQYLDAERGLINSNVTSIIEDKTGVIWISSYIGGLSRYNGTTFMNYTTREGLSNDYVTAIVEDQQGTLWIATHGGGLCSFDGIVFTHFTETDGMSSNYINCLYPTKSGKIWLGTRNRGISCFEPPTGDQPGKITHYGLDEGIPNVEVRVIIEDHHGNLWVALGATGVARLSPDSNGKPGTVTYFTEADGLLNNAVNSIFEDSKGNLWFGTTSGASRLHGTTFTQYTITEGLPVNRIRTICEDSHGNLWFGTNGGGACYFDGNAFTVFSEHEGLTNNTITAFLEDASGTIWIGTTGSGLCRYNPRSFVHHTLSENLPQSRTTEIYEDSKGNLWFATIGMGVLKYTPPNADHGGALFQFDVEHGLPVNSVWSIGEDKQGNMWFGTWGGGACKFDGSAFTQYTQLNGLSSNDIRSILEDHQGNIWFATIEGGVTCFIPANQSGAGEFVQYTLREGFLANSVRTLHLDSRNALWLGTMERGTIRFDLSENDHKVTAIYFSRREGLMDAYVNDIIEDKNGRLWFATGSGVTQFDNPKDILTGRFVHFPEKTGIANSYTRSVSADALGNIWVSTAMGLSYIRADDYKVFAFHKSEGLLRTEFEFGSACLDRHNQLWWGSNQGIEMLDSKSFYTSTAVPQPHLRSIEINGEIPDFRNFPDSLRDVVKFSGVPPYENYPLNLRLPYFQDHLTFNYSAIDWLAPSRIRYSYLMEGLNDGWSVPSSETKAEYRNLPAGSYSFKVRAVGESQYWSDPFIYSFTIRPPWWFTWWAYLIYALCGLGIVFATYRLQLKRRLEIAERARLLELDELKNKLYVNITHEFRTPLTLIHGPLAHALSFHTQLDESSIKSMYQQSKRLQQLITQMLDLQKAEAGKLKSHFVYGDVVEPVRSMFNAFNSYAKEKGITLDFLSSLPLIEMDYDEEKLTQILTNLVTNAIRHTPRDGHVSLSLHVSDSTLHVEIQDTGIGISEQELPFIFDRYYQSSRAAQGGTGIGLALAKSLVELLKGTISVTSSENKGTTFRFSLPITHVSKTSSASVAKNQDFIFNGLDDETHFLPSQNVNTDKPIVLIVEDHPEVSQFIASCLRKDYTTMIALDGKEGISKAFEHIPDLVISDVMMPGMDGFEVCAKLKNDIQTSHIPVILLTGRGDQEALMEGIEQGADAYVVKPFEPAELLLRVKKLLELRKLLCEYYRNRDDTTRSNQPEKTSPREHAFVEKLKVFIEDHINDPQLSMHMLCQHMAMSHSQLHRKITALTGETTGKLVRSVRLSKAIELLRNSDLTVSEIAYETGFSEPSYFTKVFSKEYDMTPTEYRGSIP